MITRLKAGLKQSYIGAIVIALIAADGIRMLVGVLLIPINNYAMRDRLMDTTGFALKQPLFPAGELLTGFARSIVHLGTAYLILRWLYPVIRAAPEIASEPEQPNAEA